MPGFERTDRIGVLQGQADIVQAVQQAVLTEVIDFKRVGNAIGSGHGLRIQVDGQRVTLGRFALRE